MQTLQPVTSGLSLVVPDGARISFPDSDDLLVAVPEYHKLALKPRNFQAFCDMLEPTHGPLGIWEIKRWDAVTGRILSRLWAKNVITDVGATAMLKNTWYASGSQVSIYNQVAITTNGGSTTLTTALSNGQTGVVSLAVAAVPATIPNGTVLTLGFGTAQTQNVTMTAQATAGATSISVSSFTANAAYAIGTNVVANATTSDNPSALSGTVYYSGALATGAFAYSGSGAGNRQVVITASFAASSGQAGLYTEAWTVNTNPVSGTGQTASHLFMVAQPINSGAGATFTITEKC